MTLDEAIAAVEATLDSGDRMAGIGNGKVLTAHLHFASMSA